MLMAAGSRSPEPGCAAAGEGVIHGVSWCDGGLELFFEGPSELGTEGGGVGGGRGGGGFIRSSSDGGDRRGAFDFGLIKGGVLGERLGEKTGPSTTLLRGKTPTDDASEHFADAERSDSGAFVVFIQGNGSKAGEDVDDLGVEVPGTRGGREGV
mmetsp:Transcript_26066/g.84123  ORF Transcript_26066/g.84123 Transcript_26066/m.84123 type:complete len:154 (+) Transcript_26066:1154-1615(+)